MKLFKRFLGDQNLHRATVAIIGHEITDWLVVANLLSLLIVTFSLPFWFIMLGAGISMFYGVFQAHWLIELHDRLDTHSKPRNERLIRGFPHRLGGEKE